MESNNKTPNEAAQLRERVDGLEKEIAVMKTLVYTSKEVLTLEEAAAFLGISRSTLYKMTHNQVIPYFKPQNKLVYFERSELLNWLRQNPVASRPQIEAAANATLQRLASRK